MKKIIFMGMLLIVLIPIKIVLSACGDNTSTPTLVEGKFTAAPFDYNCNFGAPLLLTKANKGMIKVSTVNTTPPINSWNQPMDYMSSYIDCGAGIDCCATVYVPSAGDFTAQVRYVEFNTPTCNTGTTSCYRWWYNQTLTSGTVPSCSYSIAISQIPTEGSIGPCNL